MMSYTKAAPKKSRTYPTYINVGDDPNNLAVKGEKTWAQVVYSENVWDSLDEVNEQDANNDGRYILELDGNFVLASTTKLTNIGMEYGVSGKGSSVYDLRDHIKYEYDQNGNCIFNGGVPQEVIDKVLSQIKQPVVEEKEFIVKGTKELTIEDIFDIANKPVRYFSHIKENKSNINYLLVETLCNPGSFDELFIVQEKGPESPLLKSYLNNLANYLIVELKNKDEIDNLEDLQKKAYDKTNYQGKSFEVVLQEAKDFSEYLRFLITKDEKLVISPEEFEYSTNLKNAVRSFGCGFSSKNQKLHVELKMDLFVDYYISTKVNQQVTLVGGKDHVKEVIYVPDIKNLTSYIEEEGYDLKIAFIKKMLNITPTIFGCDKDYNFQTFEIRQSTIVKWMKKLDTILQDIKFTLDKGGRHVPTNCIDNTII